jgi:hypothetical protein
VGQVGQVGREAREGEMRRKITERTGSRQKNRATKACYLGYSVALFIAVVSVPSVAGAADTIEGRWKLLAAEDLRADGTVARYPWGRQPVGSIVVAGGACFVQIMSSDVPGPKNADEMRAALLSSYIAYEGPCTIDESAGSVTLKVEAAWRPDYVGTEQKRFFRFDGGKLFFGPAPNSIRGSTEQLTRRLTLERVQ